MDERSPSPQGSAETREARTGVGFAASQRNGRPAALRELRPAGFYFRRQVAVERVVVDFACLNRKLSSECDGGQHGADDHARKDRRRDQAHAELGFRVLRFWNVEVDRNLAGVMETIIALLGAAHPHPGPPLRSGSALPFGEGEHA